MGIFDEQLAIDSELFVDTDGFGETVVYTKRTGATRTIKAVIIRASPNSLTPNQKVYTRSMDIFVRNDSTYGISDAELDTGGDTITVAYVRGEAAEPFQIHLPTGSSDQDAGMLHLELR